MKIRDAGPSTALRINSGRQPGRGRTRRSAPTLTNLDSRFHRNDEREVGFESTNSEPIRLEPKVVQFNHRIILFARAQLMISLYLRERLREVFLTLIVLWMGNAIESILRSETDLVAADFGKSDPEFSNFAGSSGFSS